MESIPDKKYWAFISYSSKDKKWGQWLHRRLESYPIPKEFQGTELFDGAILGKNLRPIFRDRDELSGSSDLGPAILKALQQSRYLIVLCSQNSAKSEWVNKEIEDFKKLHGEKNILALILDGEPNSPDQECFPPALRYPVEPLAGDLRKEGDGKERGFLKVLSGIAQLDFDTLYRRHERSQKKKRRTLATLAAIIITSLTALSIYAINQKNHATKQQAIAKENEQEALKQKQAAKQSAQIATEQKQIALQKAEDERAALKKSQQELYFANITTANSAISQNDPLTALAALAQAPEQHRSWEWSYLFNRTHFAPIEIPTNHIALLDTGPLKGSGLYQEALKALKDLTYRSTFAYGKDICLRAYPSTRSGARLEISRSNWLPLLADFDTISYGDITHVWLSNDQSVALVLSDTIRTRSQSLGNIPENHPTTLSFYLIPIPRKDVFVPISSPISLETIAEDSTSENEGSITYESLNIKTYPNGILTARSSDFNGEIYACFPSKLSNNCAPEKTQSHLIDYENDAVRAAYYSLPKNKQPAAHAWLMEKRQSPSEDFSDPFKQHTLAVDWSSPNLPILSIEQAQAISITNLTNTKQVKTAPLTDKRTKEIWDFSSLMPGSYDTGGAFSSDGSKFLLCPLTTNQAATIETDKLTPIKTLSNRDPSQKGPDNFSFLCANDNTARPGSSVWRLSPKSNYAYLTGYDAPSAFFYFALADLKTGQPLILDTDRNIIAADWSSDESLFATYDGRRNNIHLYTWPKQQPLNSFHYSEGQQGSRIIQEFPDHPDRLLIGNTLIQKSTQRIICTFPSNLTVAQDASWAATRISTNAEFPASDALGNRKFHRMQITHTNTPNSLADKVKQFQIQTLSSKTLPKHKLTEFTPPNLDEYEKVLQARDQTLELLRKNIATEIKQDPTKALKTSLKIIANTKNISMETERDLAVATYLLAANGKHEESIKLSKIASLIADDQVTLLGWAALKNNRPEQAYHLFAEAAASTYLTKKKPNEDYLAPLVISATLAERHTQSIEAYKHLVEINPQWKTLEKIAAQNLEPTFQKALEKARLLYLKNLTE